MGLEPARLRPRAGVRRVRRSVISKSPSETIIRARASARRPRLTGATSLVQRGWRRKTPWTMNLSSREKRFVSDGLSLDVRRIQSRLPPEAGLSAQPCKGLEPGRQIPAAGRDGRGYRPPEHFRQVHFRAEWAGFELERVGKSSILKSERVVTKRPPSGGRRSGHRQVSPHRSPTTRSNPNTA